MAAFISFIPWDRSFDADAISPTNSTTGFLPVPTAWKTIL
jgi:hypothetical protein